MKAKSSLDVFNSALETKKFEPIYVFYGQERGIMLEYVSELKKHFKNIVETDDYKQIVQDLNFNSIFGGKKLYILKDTELFNKKVDDDFLQLLAKLITRKTHTVVFVENTIDKSYKQVQALPDATKVEFNVLNEAQLVAIVSNVLDQQKIKYNKDTIKYFINVCNSDYTTITNELSKIINYSKEFTVEAVDAVCSKSNNLIVFDLINFILKGNYGRALDLYETLILRKESPIVILNLMYRQLRLLYQIKLMRMSGINNIQELAELCDSTPYIIEKNLNATNFDISKILSLLVKCSELDYKIKLGQIKDVTAGRLFILYSSTT